MAESRTDKIIVGKSYQDVNDINYKEITERLVKLERQLANNDIFSLAPVGAIIAWDKSATGTPQILSSNWVECNGQTLSDPGSPFNGQVIPNLNGAAAGANSPNLARKEQMFLRGGTTSSTGQDYDTKAHNHTYDAISSNVLNYIASGGSYAMPGAGTTVKLVYTTQNYPSSGGTETRPANMSVVWIKRVK